MSEKSLQKSKKIKKLNFSLQFNYTLMTVPGLLWLVLFSIVPMVGILMAFEDYNPTRGWFRSEWVGLDNFKYLFSMGDAWQVLINTLVIASAKVILNLVIPLAFALLLNEIQRLRYKKIIQTIVYLPHFISWVVLASIILSLFSYNGVVNSIAGMFGKSPRVWMNDAGFFRPLAVFSDVWKEFGYNAVIFLAALRIGRH